MAIDRTCLGIERSDHCVSTRVAFNHDGFGMETKQAFHRTIADGLRLCLELRTASAS